LDQAMLIFREFGRQLVKRKPTRTLDFKAAGLRTSDGSGPKIDFDLAWSGKGPHKKHFDILNLNANFLAQFASQSCFRLLSPAQEPTGNSPAAVGPKNVIEQQDPTLVVKDHRPGGNGEAPLPRAHQTPPQHAWQTTPYCAKEFDKHQK
jgi:hypothetical protein